MTEISARTARLGLVALGVVLRQAAPRRNGRAMPDDIRVALVELHAASSASETTLDVAPAPVTASEEIDVSTAAARLGITPQAVRKRIASGNLAGRKVSGVWLVENRQEALWE